MKCPYCEQDTMIPDEELGGGWVKCTNCGATHDTKPIKLAPYPISIEHVDEKAKWTKYKPRPIPASEKKK